MNKTLFGILLGLSLGVYTWFLVGRAGKRPFLQAMAALAVGLLCLDIWGTATMILGHLAICFAVFDGLYLLLKWLLPKRRAHLALIHKSHLLPLILFVLVMWYGSVNMGLVYRTDYTVTTDKDIRPEGYRILYLSDLHYGTVQDPQVLEDMLDTLNAQQPDLVILGGDIVEEGTTREEMETVFTILGKIQSSFGTYFVYGNHDRQPDSTSRTYTDAELAAAIEKNGITILEDATAVINGELLLMGRADAAWDGESKRAEISQLLESTERGQFLITLDHQPIEAEKNAAAGVDLMLSGHTHAGQIFPVGYLSEWMGTLNYGRYACDGCEVIVSSGFAGWGYPVRTQGKCEYVVVELTRA